MDKLKATLEKSGCVLTEKQMLQFEIYYNILYEWNKKMNLTNILDKEDVYVKHFLDSLMVSQSLELDNQSVLDVGSGAGFPSIPLKIMFPNLQVTILDALRKRITFLDHLTSVLNVDVELIHARAEDFDRKNSFDLVTARAVAPMNKLLELTLPFVKEDGYFVALKGDKYREELTLAQNALMELNGTVFQTDTFTLNGDFRAVILFHKYAKNVKKYPRSSKHIKKTPL